MTVPQTRMPVDEWSIDGFRALILYLLESGVPILDLQGFSAGEEGVWLRHDVELDLSAATKTAEVEAELGVRATYFVCPESPFISARPDGLRNWAETISDLGHAVSLHMFLGRGLDTLESRLESAATLVDIEPPADLTFHAPGLDSQVLARAPGGARVYERMASRQCQYLSDSTSRWRWGSPWTAEYTARPTQLLTHPFWWAGDRARVRSLCTTSDQHADFLPQFRAEVLGL